MKKIILSSILTFVLLINSYTTFARTIALSTNWESTTTNTASTTVSSSNVSNSVMRLIAKIIGILKERYTFTEIQEFAKKVEGLIANSSESKKPIFQYLLAETNKLLVSLDTQENSILITKDGVKKIDNNVYELLINKYCADGEIVPVRIDDITTLTNQQIKEYADRLFENKDIERLWLLQARLTHSLKPSTQAYYKDRWMTTSEYLYPSSLQTKLSDDGLNILSQMLNDISENSISNNLAKWSVLNHNIWITIFALSHRLVDLLDEYQLEEMLMCSIEKYYEPFGMYLSAQYYDNEWDAKSAYYYVNLARELEKINPKNLSNKYKVGTMWEEFSNLYKKYIYSEKQWISSDESRAIKKEIEATIMKKYPQLVDIYYGWPLYNK